MNESTISSDAAASANERQVDLRRPAIPSRAAWWTGSGLLLGLSAAALARRLQGAFLQPLTTPTIILVMLVVVAASLLLRRTMTAVVDSGNAVEFLHIPRGWSWRRSGSLAANMDSNVAGPHLWLAGLLSLANLLLLLALTVPGTPILGAISAWSCVIAIETAWWTSRLRGTRVEHAAWSPPPAMQNCSATARPAGGSCEPLPDESLPREVLQRQIRTRADGIETVFGAIRLEFGPEDRRQAAHIVFCPPWSTVPEFQIEQTEGPDADLEVSQLAPYGARVEARLTEAESTRAEIVLQFEARES